MLSMITEGNLSHWKVVAQIQERSIAKLSKYINIVHPENGSGKRNWGT